MTDTLGSRFVRLLEAGAMIVGFSVLGCVAGVFGGMVLACGLTRANLCGLAGIFVGGPLGLIGGALAAGGILYRRRQRNIAASTQVRFPARGFPGGRQ